MRTRAEHLEWAKKRALREMEYAGDPKEAPASMASDLGKHPETRGHRGPIEILAEIVDGRAFTLDEMRERIEAIT